MSEAAATETKTGFPRETYREIITQTVCGTAQKSFKYNQYIDPPRGSVPDQVLGCSVIGLELQKPEVKESSNGSFTLQAGGNFEVHVWYTCNHGKDTDVLLQTVKFDEVLPLNDFECPKTDRLDVRVKQGKKNMVLVSATIEKNRIKLNMELNYSAEVIGETKLLVQVCAHP